jgi:FlaA1/EpsC-like NDP-sugar epimerase
VHLAGLTVRDERNPEGDIEIRFTGLRPAEKLYEELLIGTNVSGTEHPMIMRAMEHSLPWEGVQEILTNLLNAMGQFDVGTTCALLREAVSEYRPTSEIADTVWCRRAEERRPASNVTSLETRRLTGRREPTGLSS